MNLLRACAPSITLFRKVPCDGFDRLAVSPQMMRRHLREGVEPFRFLRTREA
jgi:hypothetical protein